MRKEERKNTLLFYEAETVYLALIDYRFQYLAQKRRNISLTFQAIADTGLQFLSLVVDKQMDFKSASNIVSVAQDILAHGIDVAPQWSANIMDSSYKQ